MRDGNGSTIQKEHTAKIILTLVFLGGFALFTGWMIFFGPGLNLFSISTMDLVLLGLATYRLGRLVAYDRVMEPFRRFFTETLPDPTGAGDTVNPKGIGFQQSIGQLICCPICAGTWIAALLTYLVILFPGPTRVFLTMTAAIGIAELLGALTEALSWSGQYARTMAGSKMLERQGHPVEFPERAPTNQTKDQAETYREYR